jgi:hypothetical protein
MFKILVVEDDQNLNKTVCSYLNQNGYETVGCLSANTAYDAMYGGTLCAPGERTFYRVKVPNPPGSGKD